ncbi:MAG: N-acetylornithine carbamoyltransferase [Bacteroidetes bacterium]|jgi:N-acetylornithine carbamoyltransferase|nr:N-acetylornithine carbamoyltransferase [Bacteroidota bacterium]
MPHLLDWHGLDDSIWKQQLDAALLHHRAGTTWSHAARGKSIALMFFNPSLRTRTSMELAATQLGAHATTLVAGQGTWSFAWDEGVVMDGAEAEHINEAVGVLSRYYDALGVRVFASMTDYEKDRSEQLLHTFAQAADVPVINLESAFHHPCQALADAATLKTHFGDDLSGKRLVLAWTHHPKALPMAVPNSALLMASRLGMDVTVARPDSYALDPGVMAQATSYAAAHGASVVEMDDLDAACDGADVIYAKAWGGPMVYTDPDQEAQIRQQATDWRITADRMARTQNGVFMHCLPVRRNVVVDDAVLDGPQALHLLQSEFRLHAQKAILEYAWDLCTPANARNGHALNGHALVSALA